MSDEQTIFAPASAIAKAGVTVFRLSGDHVRDVLTRLCVPKDIPPPRKAVLRNLKNPLSGDILDRALVLYFPSPHSFTGEDVAELHTHGGRAVANAVTEVLRQLPHVRLAEAGEFTRRAFENGKMDLTEAEAIADLVHAETEAQRKQALRQLDGALGKLYENWRLRLVRALAYMEAAIDFSDEELPADMMARQSTELHVLRGEIEAHLNDKHRGERLREGFSIAILGPPNAGKSSLLNTLARKEAAIVSPLAGTTRDVIEVHLDMGGYPVTLADTAGLRETTDSIETEGVQRARIRAAEADLKLLVLDASSLHFCDDSFRDLIDADTIIVMNKSDLGLKGLGKMPLSGISLSTLSGEGIDHLLKKLTSEIKTRFDSSSAPPLTRARHRTALEECVSHLTRALQAPLVDQCAEDVRLATRSLGRITGRVDVEDLLDIIFRDFCIGK